MHRCLAIARSHALVSAPKQALALLSRASTLLGTAHPTLSSLAESEAATTTVPTIAITSTSLSYISTLLTAELQRHRALVELANLKSTTSASETSSVPVVERLNDYPASGVDLQNLVSYPPKMVPVPVKPLFFDVAWNYIDYPGHAVDTSVVKPEAKLEADEKEAERPATPVKKGWFGFGR